MNVFELMLLVLHIAVFASIVTLVGTRYGWLAGLAFGAAGVLMAVTIERLLAAMCTRIFHRKQTSNETR